MPPVVPHLLRDEQGGDTMNQQQKQQSATFQYYASMDDDGGIAVYRIRERVCGGTEKSNRLQRHGRHAPSRPFAL